MATGGELLQSGRSLNKTYYSVKLSKPMQELQLLTCLIESKELEV